MAKVFITYKLPEAGEEFLREEGMDVTVRDADELISRAELLAALTEYDAVIPLLTDKIGESELSEAEKLGELTVKVIANYAVGYDNIDVEACTKRGITVTNTPDVLTDAVAEHTVSLLASIARRILESDNFTRAGKYQGWRPQLLLGTGLNGKTLGIVGLGRIGAEVARRAKGGFDMEIAYNDLKPSEQFEQAVGATYYEKLEDMLPEVDAISLHVPLLPATTHLINSERLSLMKSTALLVNTSRGPVIDEDSLVKALQDKTIAGAAMDVFENEPSLADGLAELSNVVLTPHTASATIEVRSAMAELAAKNAVAVLSGEEAVTPVTK